MITSVDDWLLFLRRSHSVIGLPLVIGGVGLMLFGWRLWKLCVMLSYALIGALVGALVVGPSDERLVVALGCGAVLGMASYWGITHAVSLLGGLIGAGVVTYSLANIGLSGWALWILGAAALIACTAFASLNRQNVVIVVTAFFGAVLLVSGAAVWLMTLPNLYTPLQAVSAGGTIILPFVLLVPTVVSCFYQSAEVRRLDAIL